MDTHLLRKYGIISSKVGYFRIQDCLLNELT